MPWEDRQREEGKAGKLAKKSVVRNEYGNERGSHGVNNHAK